MKRNKCLNFYLFLLLCSLIIIPYNAICSPGTDNDDPSVINKSFLPAPDELQKWFAQKDAGGATFAGSPSWKSYMAFLEKGFQKHGLTDIQKDVITYDRWFTSDDRTEGKWSLTVDGKNVPVASYWAYSGSTPPSDQTPSSSVDAAWRRCSRRTSVRSVRRPNAGS